MMTSLSVLGELSFEDLFNYTTRWQQLAILAILREQSNRRERDMNVQLQRYSMLPKNVRMALILNNCRYTEGSLDLSMQYHKLLKSVATLCFTQNGFNGP